MELASTSLSPGEQPSPHCHCVPGTVLNAGDTGDPGEAQP